ncbi:MAG: hypothetical protein K2L91_09270 [Duncaniella sp.]|nr:hypothetical protein [Duncaniella sp.]
MNEDYLNNQAENQECTPKEALEAMRRECGGVDMAGVEPDIPESRPESDSLSEASKMGFEEYSKMAITVFRQINDMMGEYFDSLKVANENFSRYADTYFETARQISAKTDKRELTDQEFDDLVSNLLVGMAVKGVGSMWSTIKTQVLLEKVKAVLRAEAETKLKSIQAIKENITTVIECAGNQYDLCVENNSGDLKDLHEKFDALRLSLFTERLMLFLETTYLAAQKNSFQNEYPYPSLFDLNQQLLDWLLNLDEKHSSIDAKTDYYRKAIKKTVDDIERSIKEGVPPTAAEALLAMDSGLMAIAVYDCNPQETIGYTDDGELKGVDKDSLKPECISNLRMFCELYELGVEYKSTSQLGALLCENTSLKVARKHIMSLYYVTIDYGKRMLPLNINIFLGGILAFLLAMSNGIKWYWSLLLGILALVLMVLVSPAKAITRRFMKKLTYVERTINVTAMRNAGYSESIDLHAIQLKNRMGCMLAIIGFLIGSIFSPLGAVFGLLAGFLLAGLLSDKDDDKKKYDYNAVHTGSVWKGYLITAVLAVGIIFTVSSWVKSTPDSVGASSSENVQTVEEVTKVVEDADVASLSDESVTREAEIELLRIYRPNSDVALDGHFDNLDGSRTPYYSENLKNRFKEEGITKGVDNPYSRSFVQLLERVSEAEEKSDNLILDSDLLHMGQGDVMNLDLRIVSVEKKDNDNVEVKADFTNGETHRRIYVLKREEGVFKIDDFIDNGESVRKWLNDEIKSHNATISAEGTNGTIDNWQLVGTVGDYSVVFYLDSSNNEIKGKYAYKSTLSKYGDIPANYFYLSGSFSSDNKITLFSHQYNKDEAFEKMDLTINNQNSGISLSGTLHNMNNGDQYSIELKSR